jgi:hypothetical protein
MLTDNPSTDPDHVAVAAPIAPDRRLTLIAVLLALLVIIQGSQAIQGFSTRAQAWEYGIVAPADEQLQTELGKLGTGGWEVVSARRATSERDGRTTGIYELIMRRPAQMGANGPQLAPER